MIDLKENCGLYLRGVYQRAVCICYAMRDVFVFSADAKVLCRFTALSKLSEMLAMGGAKA